MNANNTTKNASKQIKSDDETQSKGEGVRGSHGIFINPSIKGQRIRPGQIHSTDESRPAQMVHQEGFSFLDFGKMFPEWRVDSV